MEGVFTRVGYPHAQGSMDQLHPEDCSSHDMETQKIIHTLVSIALIHDGNVDLSTITDCKDEYLRGNLPRLRDLVEIHPISLSRPIETRPSNTEDHTSLPGGDMPRDVLHFRSQQASSTTTGITTCNLADIASALPSSTENSGLKKEDIDKKFEEILEGITGIPHVSTNELSQETRGPGRPGNMYNKEEGGQPRLWWFCFKELEDPNSPLMRWLDRSQGIFCLVYPVALAEKWGKVKNNTSMNYEKFSRGLRYYYKVKVLERVPGRLVYKFGPKAKVWHYINQVDQNFVRQNPGYSGMTASLSGVPPLV